jgi:hypothetical protein
MCSLVLPWEILATLEADFDDATAVLAVPEPYRRRLKTSNGTVTVTLSRTAGAYASHGSCGSRSSMYPWSMPVRIMSQKERVNRLKQWRAGGSCPAR